MRDRIFYRFREVADYVSNFMLEYAEFAGVHLECDEYLVIAETPKGVWVAQKFWAEWGERGNKIPNGCKKFILNLTPGAKKRFAYEDIDAALKSFVIRKRRQIEHCETQLRNAKLGLEKAKALQAKRETA